MKTITKVMFPIVLVIAALAATAGAPSAQAQSTTFTSHNGWVRMASVTYPGGTARLDVPFAADVETRQIGVEVSQFCAPRALASRARVLDDMFPGSWPRLVSLRFVNQTNSGGVIRAFYAVDEGVDAIPYVTGLQFSLTQVVPGPARACRMDFYALPSRS